MIITYEHFLRGLNAGGCYHGLLVLIVLTYISRHAMARFQLVDNTESEEAHQQP
jgi:hypothetical protein